jgi:hypothetical protein
VTNQDRIPQQHSLLKMMSQLLEFPKVQEASYFFEMIPDLQKSETKVGKQNDDKAK